MSKIYRFKFLDSYKLEDSTRFFGRDEEIDTLYEMVFQTNILVVYGASGTGKTSLLQCGLASRFHFHDWHPLFIRRGRNINESLKEELEAECNKNMHNDDDSHLSEPGDVPNTTTTATKKLSPLALAFQKVYLNSFRRVYLIFDQFEELFILGNEDEQKEFYDTVCEILKLTVPVKMIFSIREEYIGYLNKFEEAVPQLMRKRLRIEPMSPYKVRQVITGLIPLDDPYIGYVKNNEKEDVPATIAKILTGGKSTATIQLPHLQIFLDKLYMSKTNDSTYQSGALFDVAFVSSIGSISDILGDFLTDRVKIISDQLCTDYVHVQEKPVTGIQTVAPQEIAAAALWRFLDQFVTDEKTKRHREVNNTIVFAGNTAKDIADAFEKNRILLKTGEENVYELTHDTLAITIAKKRSDKDKSLREVRDFIRSQTKLHGNIYMISDKMLDFISHFRNNPDLSAEERDYIEACISNRDKKLRKKRTRRIVVFAGLVIGSLIMTVLALNALVQKGQARSDALASLSLKELYQNDNVTLAYRYAQYAWEKNHENLNAKIALYNTVFQPLGEPVKLFYSDINTHDPNDSRIDFSRNGSSAMSFTNNSINIIDLSGGAQHAIPDLKGTIKALLSKEPKYRDGLLTFQFSDAGKFMLIKNTYKDSFDCYVYNTENRKMKETFLFRKLCNGTQLFFAPGDAQIFIPVAERNNDGEIPFDSNQDIDKQDSLKYRSIESYDANDFLRSGILMLTASVSRINAEVFTKDGKNLAIYSSDGRNNYLEIFGKVAGQRQWTSLKCFTSDIKDSIFFAFSGDDRYLAVKRVRTNPAFFSALKSAAKNKNYADSVFDLPDMHYVKKDQAFAEKFTANSQRLILDSTENILCVYDFINDSKVFLTAPQKDNLDNFADAMISPDGSCILTRRGYHNGYKKYEIEPYPLILWPVSSGNDNSPGNSQFQGAVTTIDAGKRIFIEANKTHVRTNGEFKYLFSPDGRYLLTFGNEKSANLWDVNSGDQIAVLAQSGIIRKAVFSGGGNFIFTASSDSFIKKWSLERFHNRANLPAKVTNATVLKNAVFDTTYHNILGSLLVKGQGAALTMNARKFATFQSLIVTTDPKGKTDTFRIKDNKNMLYSIIGGPDGSKRYFLGVFGSNYRNNGENNIRPRYSTLYDIQEQRDVASYNETGGFFSRDGKFLALYDLYSNQILLADVKTGRELVKIYIPQDDLVKLKNAIPDYAFSADSKQLMVRYRYQARCANNSGTIYDTVVNAYWIEPAEIINNVNKTVPGDLTPRDKKAYNIDTTSLNKLFNGISNYFSY